MVAVCDKRLVKTISGDSTRASKQIKSLNLQGKQQRSRKSWISTRHLRDPIGRPQTHYLATVPSRPRNTLLSTFMNSSHSSSHQCVSLRAHSHQQLQFVCWESRWLSLALVWTCNRTLDVEQKCKLFTPLEGNRMQEVIDSVKGQRWTALILLNLSQFLFLSAFCIFLHKLIQLKSCGDYTEDQD